MNPKESDEVCSVCGRGMTYGETLYCKICDAPYCEDCMHICDNEEENEDEQPTDICDIISPSMSKDKEAWSNYRDSINW